MRKKKLINSLGLLPIYRFHRNLCDIREDAFEKPINHQCQYEFANYQFDFEGVFMACLNKKIH